MVKKGTSILKICANCKHYDGREYPDGTRSSLEPWCTRNYTEYQDIITGETRSKGLLYAKNERAPNDPKLLKLVQAALTLTKPTYRCGPEAIYYETTQPT